MNLLYKVFLVLKPVLPVLLIVGLLQISGQLTNVLTYGQSAILKTGLLNADSEPESSELFDYAFDAYTPDGQKLNTEELKNKVVFINIWATWCGPCRAEMPTIQNLYESTHDPNIVFIILSKDMGGNAAMKVSQYIKKNNFTFPVYIAQGKSTDQLEVPSIPVSYVVSKKGKIALSEVGMRNYNTDRFKKFLKKLSAE